MRILSKR
jgi:hypothetical protein